MSIEGWNWLIYMQTKQYFNWYTVTLRDYLPCLKVKLENMKHKVRPSPILSKMSVPIFAEKRLENVTIEGWNWLIYMETMEEFIWCIVICT